MIDVVNIPTDAIEIPEQHRKVDPVYVQGIAEDIHNIGQLSPIEVLALEDGKYRLIFGAHRLAAIQSLGRHEIAATVRNVASFKDETAIQLRTISENFVRRELTVLDRSVDIATWCEIYRAAHTNIKPGKKSGVLSATVALNSLSPEQLMELSEKFELSFSEAAKLAFKMSRRSIFDAIKIASIPEDLRRKIALTPIANSTRELLVLASENTERQKRVIKIVSDEDNLADTVTDAIALIDRTPMPQKEERWQKVFASFGQLKQSEQYRFFDMNEDAINQWLADKNGINTEKEVA